MRSSPEKLRYHGHGVGTVPDPPRPSYANTSAPESSRTLSERLDGHRLTPYSAREPGAPARLAPDAASIVSRKSRRARTSPPDLLALAARRATGFGLLSACVSASARARARNTRPVWPWLLRCGSGGQKEVCRSGSFRSEPPITSAPRGRLFLDPGHSPDPRH